MWIATLTRFILLLLLSSVCGYESYDYAENGENADYEYEEEETFADFVPIFQTDPTTYTVDKGNTARLLCQVDQLGPMVISWKKVKQGNNLAYVAAGKSVMEDPDRFSVEVDDVSSTLTILLVNREDMGQYICEVSSQPPVTLKHTVEIKAPPSVSILGKPESGRLTFKSGSELALVCEGDGDPKPNIKWRRRNKKMPDGSAEMAADQIIYNSIDRKHVGIYICEGDNGFGAPAIDSIHIQVLYPPTVYVDETYLHQADSVVLELVCMVQAHPPAKVSWKRNDKPLQEGRYRMEHRSSKHILAIDSPTKYDMGIYTCTASNSEGTVHAVKDVQDTDNEQNLPQLTSFPKMDSPSDTKRGLSTKDSIKSTASSNQDFQILLTVFSFINIWRLN